MRDELAPVRIRLSRQKGWRMPANTVKVDRSTKWGNPFRAGETYNTVAAGMMVCESAADAVRLFTPCAYTRRQEIVSELRGKNLACWCKPGAPCHADVLLDLANAPPTDGAAPDPTKVRTPKENNQ